MTDNYTTPLGGVTVILTLIFAWSSELDSNKT